MIKREKKMLIILGGIVLVTLLILYFFLMRGKISYHAPLTAPKTIMPGVESFEVTLPELNLDILDDSRFQDLRPYGSLPIEVKDTGRDNPFIPY